MEFMPRVPMACTGAIRVHIKFKKDVIILWVRRYDLKSGRTPSPHAPIISQIATDGSELRRGLWPRQAASKRLDRWSARADPNREKRVLGYVRGF